MVDGGIGYGWIATPIVRLCIRDEDSDDDLLGPVDVIPLVVSGGLPGSKFPHSVISNHLQRGHWSLT